MNLDEALLLFINGHNTVYWDQFMLMLTHRFTWIPLYIALAYSVVRTLGWKRALWFLAAVGLMIVMTDQVCSHVIRPWVQRLRPTNEANPLSSMLHIVDNYRGASYGMPSAHAANTVALITILLRRFRTRILATVLGMWVLSQVYSRMYLGVHYPTDILVGAMVGGCCAILSYLIHISASRRLRPDDDIARAELLHPWVPVAVMVLTLGVISLLAI